MFSKHTFYFFFAFQKEKYSDLMSFKLLSLLEYEAWDLKLQGRILNLVRWKSSDILLFSYKNTKYKRHNTGERAGGGNMQLKIHNGTVPLEALSDQ